MTKYDFNQEVKVVLESVGRKIVKVGDGLLSSSDDRLVRSWLYSQHFLLYDLLSDSSEGRRLYRGWLCQPDVLDVFSFGTWRKQVSALLRAYPELFCKQGAWSVSHFKHEIASGPSFWGFISPVQKVLDSFLLNPAPATMAVLLQWVDYSIKLNLIDVDYTQDCIDDYVEAEEFMTNWSYDSCLIDCLNSIMREWFSGFVLEDIIPQNGPGAVAELHGRTPGLFQKYCAFAQDSLTDLLGRKTPSGSFRGLYPETPVTSSLNRTSELLFVPKSMVTNRSISKEPAFLQYLQQGVRRQINQWISTSPLLSPHICFEDQNLSQSMAREGSYFGEYATVDLSAASDSVTVRLVKYLFRGTKLLTPLICTRSKRTRLPNGANLLLEKFAPMGSALCFPIQTVIFCACCELACRATHSDHRLRYRVYGDDIVISVEACDKLLDILKMLHFRVNLTKSFTFAGIVNFREACGGEFLNGADVAPVRISRSLVIPDTGNLSPGKFDSQIGLLNRLFEKDLFLTRKALVQLFRRDAQFRLAWNCTPVTDEYLDTSRIFVCSGTATNFHLKTKRDEFRDRVAYQCPVYRALRRIGDCQSPGQLGLGFLSDEELFGYSESIRLFEWFRRAASDPRRLRLSDPILQPIFITEEDVWPHTACTSIKKGSWTIL